jgi:hypothetical protein
MTTTPLLRRKRGRPSSAVLGTLAVVHPVTGRALGWSDGFLAGDPQMTAAARALVAAGALLPVPGTGAWTVAAAGDLVAAFAVLAYVAGGRGDLVTGDLPHAALHRLTSLALLDPDDLLDALSPVGGK